LNEKRSAASRIDAALEAGMSSRLMVTLALVMMWSGIAAAQTEWVLYEGNPVVPRPEADEWPGFLRWIEAVIVVDGTFHMWYTGLAEDFSEARVGYATSPDGLSWTKDPGNPIEELEEPGGFAEQAQVLLHADRRECEMFYNVPTVFGQPVFKVNRATSACRAQRLQTQRVSGVRVPVRGGRAAAPSEHR
jgi:hypothetical protein